MKRLRSHFLVALAAATLTAVVVGGFAWATIPDNMNGTISACFRLVGPNKGSMRVIDRQAGKACHSDERLLSWSTRGFHWRGQWNGRVAYKTNDVVGYNGSSYIATKGTTNVLPSSTGYWSLMTAAGGGTGAVGPQGPPGATGPSGPSGPTGVAGPTGADGSTTCGFPHENADWTNCDMTGANLSDANLTNATMTGMTLTGATLAGANLTGANVTTANITSANFNNADLSNVNFLGATETTAPTYIGATFLNTTCPDGTLVTSPTTCDGH